MKKRMSIASILILFTLTVLVICSPVNAALWETDASHELSGSRTSPTNSGIQATDGWDNGGLIISWDITENSGIWTYEYTVNGERKDVSHFILEVTDDGNPFNIFSGTDTLIEGPSTWTQSPSNPLMPNGIYGIKFDFGGSKALYTIVTDREPVYGVFYAKDGKDSGDNVVAWSNALDFPDYRTNEMLTATDFIVRPNSTIVPIHGTIWLLGSGLLGLLGLKRKLKNP